MPAYQNPRLLKGIQNGCPVKEAGPHPALYPANAPTGGFREVPAEAVHRKPARPNSVTDKYQRISCCWRCRSVGHRSSRSWFFWVPNRLATENKICTPYFRKISSAATDLSGAQNSRAAHHVVLHECCSGDSQNAGGSIPEYSDTVVSRLACWAAFLYNICFQFTIQEGNSAGCSIKQHMWVVTINGSSSAADLYTGNG